MSLLRKLYPFLKPHLRRLVFGLLGMGIFTLLTLLPPLAMRYLINNVVLTGAWRLLLPVVGIIVMAPLLSHTINFMNSRIIMRAGYGLISDIRLKLYEKVLDLSFRFHGEHSSGMIVNRLMDDVNMFHYLITGQTVSVIVNLIIFCFSVSIVFTISPLLAAILLAILVPYVLVYRLFSRKIRSASMDYRNVYDRIAERLQETISGVRQVRIYNREIRENAMFLDRTSISLRHALSSSVNSVALGTLCNLIAGLGSAAIASIGAYFVLTQRLQYGDLMAISSYIWMALSPAITLTTLAGQLTETGVSIRRVIEILDERIDIVNPENPLYPENLKGGIQFKDVYFSYASNVPLYRGLSLDVEPGMTVALVGPTGCGKTSLTSLLMRYWNIQAGSILIDGVDIRRMQKEKLREFFGVVLQDPILFDGTLRENIAYGYSEAPFKKIEEAAQSAEIWNMAMKLPRGFDTVIGTRGVKLSLGEKQRISIARAVVKDPLILVMDEATSSLDSESEALIQKALRRVLSGRTSFVIAHRLSTIVGADMIVAMEAGRIVEKGTHEQLMIIPNGHYRKLYEELQTGGKTGIPVEVGV